ncbi:DUF6879 family protein [Kitasatospora sp. NPDC057541]|uniref:DUF6879 family protein n=1 Tax=unclassified Kitasatospora TaxID=2633591 RepID=UPI0036809B00
MSRRLRYIGRNSGKDGYPTLYGDVETGEVLVQGEAVTDPDELAQLPAVGREPVLIGFEEFDGMFESFEHTAFRLETRRRYRSDELTETYRRFAAGQPAGWDLEDPWCRSRREQVALGKRFERVRIMDAPPTPGQRYLLDNAERNSAVGEDIRYLWRTDADRLGLPAEDTWLFDSRVIALLHFDPDDDLTGVELITDPVQVARACQVRDAAWHFATPYRAFAAEVPSGL